jgi:putative heme iron utilization protein
LINSTFTSLIHDILEQNDIIFSVKNIGGICEARIQKDMKFKIHDLWATIGDETTPWHIHLNITKIGEARFVKEFNESHNRQSYSIRFFDNCGNLVMRANFSKLYDTDGNLIQEKVSKFESIFEKYGKQESLSLQNALTPSS